MAKYSGKPVTVNHAASEVYDRVADLSSFQERLDTLPEEARAKLGDVRFTSESIIINAAPVGEMKFNLTTRVPYTQLCFEAESSPVPFKITVNLKELSETSCEVAPVIDVDIPAMLRPLVGSKMQEAADKFGEMFTNIFSH